MLTDIGVVTSSLDKDGIQMEHDIDALLYEPRLAEIFSEDIIFAFSRATCRTCAAANFRNQLAHGMLEYGAFFGETALYIWWLLLTSVCSWGAADEGTLRRSGASCLSISPTNTRPNSLSGGPRPISDIEDRTISGIMFTTL